jgi:uncharacterized membrane protein YraQ (UPF0718 family)
MAGMKKLYMIMACACLALAAVAFARGGLEALVRGVSAGGMTLLELIPLLILAFCCAGLISVVATEHTVTRWLGRKAGFRGILIGGLAGALIPGGPFIYYPVAATFMAAGAEIGAVISFVAAKNLWSVSRLPLELALLGSKLALVRYAMTLLVPVLAGLVANLLLRGHTDKMREEIRTLQQAKSAPDKPDASEEGPC